MLCRHFGFNGTIFDRTQTKHFNRSKYILAGDLMCYSELSNRTSCCIYLAPFTVNRSNNFNLPFVRCKYDCVLYNNTCLFGIFIGRELCVIKIHTNIEIINNTREGIIIFSVKTKRNTANGGANTSLGCRAKRYNSRNLYEMFSSLSFEVALPVLWAK